MKKILYMVLIVICISTLLTACGCEHQWTDATCSAPKTCTLCSKTEGSAEEHVAGDWSVTVEPVEGNSGERAQLCNNCGTALATEVYTLDSVMEGDTFTLTPEEMAARMDNILKTMRPNLSSKLEPNSKEELTIYNDWKEAGAVSFISLQTAKEKGITALTDTFQRVEVQFVVNTTQVTNDELQVPVFDLQMDTVYALIMACDPQMSQADARAMVQDFLDSKEMYTFVTKGDLEYYFFMGSLGQTYFAMAVSKA